MQSEFFVSAQIHMTGSIAERIKSGKIFENFQKGEFIVHGAQDGLTGDARAFYEDVHALAEVEEEVMPLVSWLFVRTVHQLMSRWPVVVGIANELYKKGHLSYAECNEI